MGTVDIWTRKNDLQWLSDGGENASTHTLNQILLEAERSDAIDANVLGMIEAKTGIDPVDPLNAIMKRIPIGLILVFILVLPFLMS
jgi:hypothetical protein